MMVEYRALLPIALATIGLTAFSRAEPVDFVVQTRDLGSQQSIAGDYSMRLKEAAPSGAPFALYSVDATQVSFIGALLQTDSRVVFAQVKKSVKLVEFDTTSRGGTIPVIGSVDHLDQENAGLLTQIHWNPIFRSLLLRRVRVAVLDTGVSPLASTVMARVVRYRSQLPLRKGVFDLPDALFPLEAPENQSVGHGTMVAGLAAELAPNADLIIERVADSSGSADTWTVIRGLSDAVGSNARLVNVSLGTPGPVAALHHAFEWAGSRGVITVAAGGNENVNRLLEPAALTSVVAVVGVDAQDRKASFSNWSANAPVTAPAVGVRSVNWDGNMAIWSGTSFSAPLVTGALALAIGTGVSMDPSNSPSVLRRSGDSIDALNPGYQGQLGKRLNIDRLIPFLAPKP